MPASGGGATQTWRSNQPEESFGHLRVKAQSRSGAKSRDAAAGGFQRSIQAVRIFNWRSPGVPMRPLNGIKVALFHLQAAAPHQRTCHQLNVWYADPTAPEAGKSLESDGERRLHIICG